MGDSNYSHFWVCGCSQSPCRQKRVGCFFSNRPHKHKNTNSERPWSLWAHSYLRLARMEVSWRSPGSNNWAPLRPSSSQPRRKTDRLSCKRSSGAFKDCRRCDGWCGWWSQRVSGQVLTRPAMGVGSLLIFFTKPGLIVLSSLRGRGGGKRRRGGFIEYLCTEGRCWSSRKQCVCVCVCISVSLGVGGGSLA